jgi:hypothetical protein
MAMTGTAHAVISATLPGHGAAPMDVLVADAGISGAPAAMAMPRPPHRLRSPARRRQPD